MHFREQLISLEHNHSHKVDNPSPKSDKSDHFFFLSATTPRNAPSHRTHFTHTHFFFVQSFYWFFFLRFLEKLTEKFFRLQFLNKEKKNGRVLNPISCLGDRETENQNGSTVVRGSTHKVLVVKNFFDFRWNEILKFFQNSLYCK